MKIKFLLIGLLGLAYTATFAQKRELENAQTAYDSYSVSIKVPAFAAKAKTSIGEAKTAIDKAAANEKTAALPQTFALKAAIYSGLALLDTVASTSATTVETATEALKKAKELDTKGDFKKLVSETNTNLAQYNLNFGVKYYQNKKYDMAYKSFDGYRQIFPDDTVAIYYTGLAAANAGVKDPKTFYPLALTNYTSLLTKTYSGKKAIYMDMSTIYLQLKDTTNALKIVGEGVTNFPTSSELRRREIEISLQTGKTTEVIEKIKSAIANEPQNKTLYYYEALTYSQVGDALNTSSAKAKDAATTNALHQKALDNYTLAAGLYKKALEIDPDYFDANLNMGYVLMRPAIDAYNAANKLPANKQKEYEAALAKSDIQFDLAKPYLQKAVDLNPKSVEALTNLRNYYRGKYDPAHKAENTAKAAELKKQLDAL